MLQLQFLGTSAGTPTKYRNVSAIAISCINPHGKQKKIPWMLIDCGEATQHQILKTNLSLMDLKLICITHAHGDHCYGLLGLLSSMAMNRRTEKLTIICPKDVETFVEMSLQLTHAHRNFEIEYRHHEQFHGLTLNISERHHIEIEAMALSHRIPCMGFKISQTLQYNKLDGDKLLAQNIQPCAIWGTLQHGFDVTLDNGDILRANEYCQQKIERFSIIVAGDNDQPELLTPYLQNVQLLVHEATYTDEIAQKIKSREQDAFDPKHSSAKQVAEFAQQQGIPYLALTHFSGRFMLFEDIHSKIANMGHLRAEVDRYYTGKYWLARDLFRLNITADGVESVKYLEENDIVS